VKHRWVIAIVASHVAASYFSEIFDRIINWDDYAFGRPKYYAEAAMAPIRVLPLLIKWTFGPTPVGIVVPYWIAYLFSFFIILFAIGRLLRPAKDPNLCGVCGYDLRATPDRCPECGTVPPKKEAINS
jgi:hypothetical protein